MIRYKIAGAVVLIGLLYFTTLKRWQPPKKAEPYLPLIRQVEESNNLPHNILARLLQQESSYNPNAHNVRSNAQGIAQIVPKWHPDLKDPFDPEQAIPYAGHYLRKLYNVYGHWDLALAAYNWGRGNVTNLINEHGMNGFKFMPTETKNYVASILADI